VTRSLVPAHAADHRVDGDPAAARSNAFARSCLGVAGTLSSCHIHRDNSRRRANILRRHRRPNPPRTRRYLRAMPPFETRSATPHHLWTLAEQVRRTPRASLRKRASATSVARSGAWAQRLTAGHASTGHLVAIAPWRALRSRLARAGDRWSTYSQSAHVGAIFSQNIGCRIRPVGATSGVIAAPVFCANRLQDVVARRQKRLSFLRCFD